MRPDALSIKPRTTNPLVTKPLVTKPLNTRQLCISRAVSLALATLATSLASTQAGAQQPATEQTRSAKGEVAQVKIVGTRASQRSSIAGKKNAATAVDMIVAEDVGSFPDRNVGEAISRIAGVALDRGDFGEGRTVSVRGNGPDLTRVEIDGMGVIAAGGTDMNGGGGGRGVELRELSSDLIKSVTVVKGATPDMTEGSLGGGILIKTRTGLDFDKRYISGRVAGTKSSLNDKWTPNLNAVFADKFFDGRLGVVANVTKLELRNEGHFLQNNTSGAGGYFRLADFDNSPEKTFTFQPGTLNLRDSAAVLPLHRAPLAGGGTLDFETPTELLTKAAAAATREQCFGAFPVPAAGDLSRMSDEAARTAALNYRANALATCLNQWNDYTPSNLRSIVKRNGDKRTNSDLRFDFKVNDRMTVYAKYARSNRTVYDEFLNISQGTPNVGGGAFKDVDGRLVATPGTSTAIVGGYTRSGTGIAQGVPTNVVPSSVVVDKTHHVTRLIMNDGAFWLDNIDNQMVSNNRYAQAGGDYRNGSFKAEFMLSDSRGEFERGDTRLNGVGYDYGQAELTVQQSGAWSYAYPSGTVDQSNPAGYAKLYPQTNPLAPHVSRTALLQYQPRQGETSERQAKLDMQWSPNTDYLPFLRTMKFGGQRRNYDTTSWGPSNGYVAQSANGTNPAVTVPGSALRTNITGCQMVAGAGALPCPEPGAKTGTGQNLRRTDYSMSGAAFADFITQVMSTKRTNEFFHGAADKPQGQIGSWSELDVAKALELLKVPNVNHDCTRACTGSDGKVYSMPSSGVTEKITAGYWMTDFDFTEIPYTGLSLPWGMELNGNFGWRYVRSQVAGRGQVTFESITKTAAFDPAQPGADAGVRTVTMIKDTAIQKTTTDIMPMFNLVLWPLPDTVAVRYARVKSIARRPVGDLYPTGTCSYDERNVGATLSGSGDETDMTCKGNFGNPGLKPTTNINQNLSVEWYVSNDTMLTAAIFKQKGIIGGVRRISVSNSKLFDGSGAVDPVTGKPLAGIEFTHSSLENGEPNNSTGFEVGAKMAFTKLPSVLRYTGLDANYSRTKPKVVGDAHRDLLTGDEQDIQGVPRYSWNASLWYDDGRFTARAAMQVVAARYQAIGPWFGTAGTTIRNYPALGAGNVTAPPWNPGSAIFENQTRYVDVKLGYKVNQWIDVFGEMRNAGRQMVVRGSGPFTTFENGAQSVNEFVYTGASYSFGVNLRY